MLLFVTRPTAKQFEVTKGVISPVPPVDFVVSVPFSGFLSSTSLASILVTVIDEKLAPLPIFRKAR